MKKIVSMVRVRNGADVYIGRKYRAGNSCCKPSGVIETIRRYRITLNIQLSSTLKFPVSS